MPIVVQETTSATALGLILSPKEIANRIVGSETVERTNLRANPSGELVKKFDSDGADFPVTREVSGTNGVPSYAGSWRDKHAFDGTSSSVGMGILAITFPAAGTYVVSMYVWVPTGWDGGAPFLNAGSYTSATGETSTGANLALRDQWQRIYTSLTVDAGDLAGNFSLEHPAGSPPSTAGTGVLYTDAVLVETGPTPGDYFDGDSDETASTSYRWTGTAHSSTSEQLAWENRAVPLDIADGAVYRPRSLDVPPPNPSPAYASSYDTEGSISSDEAHYDNREITVSLWVFGSAASGLEAALNDLYRYVGQINREGGVLQMTTPNDTVCYFDLEREGAATVTFDPLYTAKHFVEVECRFVARPFWRGAEVDLGTTSEITLPALVATYSGIDGDVPALGRLVVTDLTGADQFQVDVGVQSRYYDSAATAALQYAADDFTPLGVSTKPGSGLVTNAELVPTWQAILKSEIDATNAALTHKGSFRVKARLFRPTTNSGEVSVRLEWAEGDYRNTTLNDVTTYAVNEDESQFRWADLGVVHISPDSDRWEFRLLAKSTVVSDDITAHRFLIEPTTEGYVELAARVRFENPSAFSARDEFNQTVSGGSDPLAGLTAPTGGTYAGIGDTDDFVVEDTGHTAQRSAVSDTGYGRVDSLPVALTNVVAQVDFKASAATAVGGLFMGAAVRVDRAAQDFFRATYDLTTRTLFTEEVVAGAGGATRSLDVPDIEAAAFWSIRLYADEAGRWAVWFFPQGTAPPTEPIWTGYSANLATGGTLASGEAGLTDWNAGATAVTRNYKNLQVFVPTVDAAIFANQSLELAHDRARREDSAGSFWSPIVAHGRYLKIPPAGPDGRSTRLIVKGYRNDALTMVDPAIDDIQAQLYVTPRGLVVPEA